MIANFTWSGTPRIDCRIERQDSGFEVSFSVVGETAHYPECPAYRLNRELGGVFRQLPPAVVEAAKGRISRPHGPREFTRAGWELFGSHRGLTFSNEREYFVSLRRRVEDALRKGNEEAVLEAAILLGVRM